MGDGVSLLEHLGNWEVFDEARVKPIEIIMIRRRSEWFRRVKRRHETRGCRNGGEAPKRKTHDEME